MDNNESDFWAPDMIAKVQALNFISLDSDVVHCMLHEIYLRKQSNYEIRDYVQAIKKHRFDIH